MAERKQTDTSKSDLTVSDLNRLGMGFMPSKAFNLSVRLGLYDVLEEKASTAAEIASKLGFYTKDLRPTRDFLDILVSAHVIERDGLADESAVYRNTPVASRALVRTKDGYIDAQLIQFDTRLWDNWSRLEDGLRTGKPQNEARAGEAPIWEVFAKNPELAERFGLGLAGYARERDERFASLFDLSGRRTLLDVGGATGQLALLVAKQHPHMKVSVFDLPHNAPIAKKFAEKFDPSVRERFEVVSGDMFKDAWPRADVVVLGNVLHNWPLDVRKDILRRAFEALNDGGVVVALEHLIDDERRQRTEGLTISLLMALEFGAGRAFDYSFHEFQAWTREAGFERPGVLELTPITFAAFAHKPKA